MTEREMARKKAAARKARMERERKKRNRRVVMTVVLMLAVCVASVGGTIAWLTDKTAPVQNTFSPTNIDIDLTETKQSNGVDRDDEAWSAELIPGKEYSKNPEVSVNGANTDIDVYLFVKFVESNNDIAAEDNVHAGLTDVIQYTSTLTEDKGWTKLIGTGAPEDVWYRVVGKDDQTKSWKLIEDDKVTINKDLTKEMMPATGSTPSLTYTAYAIQYSGFEPEVSVGETEANAEQKNAAALEAWNKIDKN